MKISKKTIIYNFIKSLHHLSLDVCLGGVGISLYLLYLFSVPISKTYPIILFLSIFIVYNLDHLLDSHRLKNITISNPRRYFHIKYRIPILIAIFLMAPIDLYLSWNFLTTGEFFMGVAALVGICIYFLGNYLFPFFPKEILVGIVYTLGVSFVPISRSLQNQTKSIFYLLSVVCLVFLLAIVNLFVNSHLDRKDDNKEGFPSLFQRFWGERILTAIHFFVGLGVMISIFSWFYNLYPSVWHSIFFGLGFLYPGAVVSMESEKNIYLTFCRKHFRWMGEILFFQFIFLVFFKI